MKKVKQLLVALCVAAGFMACSDEETGLAPVFNNSDVNLEMRRDTADTYQISLPITSEEGLAKIALVNTTTNETIDEVTSFTDPLNYTYNYTLDLTAYTESTVLMMNLNITDLAGQTVTKKITLTINFPVIGVRFVGENLQSQFEDYNLKVAIDKGVTDLKQVDVYLGEELAESLTLDPALESQEVNVHIGGLAMGENNVRLVVIDEFDQEFTAETVVTRVAQKTWKDLVRSSPIRFHTGRQVIIDYGELYPDWGLAPGEFVETIDIQGSVELNRNVYYYPDPEMNPDFKDYPPMPIHDYPRMTDEQFESLSEIYLVSFSMRDENYGSAALNVSFLYDEETGNITRMRRDSCYMEFGDYAFISDSREDYEFTYNEENDLVSVTKNGASYITDVVYENGYIISYKVNGQECNPKYNENGDRIDNAYFGNEYTFSNDPNPLYISKLPAVVPMYVFGTDLSFWLYNRYLPTSLGSTDYTINPLIDDSQSITWPGSNTDAQVSYRFKSTEVSE